MIVKTVRFVALSDIFEDCENAAEVFSNACKVSFGDGTHSLVSADYIKEVLEDWDSLDPVVEARLDVVEIMHGDDVMINLEC